MRPFQPLASPLSLFLTGGLVLFLLSSQDYERHVATSSLLDEATFPVCYQPTLRPDLDSPDTADLNYKVYLPVIINSLPPCTAYCGLLPTDDAYRPEGFETYFAEEFDCNQLLDYWTVQNQMTAASYRPPTTGYVEVSDGTLKLGVPGQDTSFPYLYLVDDSATTYDIPYLTPSDDWVPRVDWMPNEGDVRLAMRLRFNIDALGEHRIAVYADGHRPEYAGPLFYIGADHNDQHEAWRGLIVGADRGQNFVDLGDQGYADPYTDWVVVTVDFDYTDDIFTLSVDGTPLITKPLSSFQGYPDAATRIDTLYLGSLALLEQPVAWTDIELDWIRVYAPQTTPEAVFGLQDPTLETSPSPPDAPTEYSAALPSGPFAHTPHWSEDFDQPGTNQPVPDYWQLSQNPDPSNAWTEVNSSQAKLLNNGNATGVPVWVIFDDMLPINILSTLEEGRESPVDYLRRRGGSPLLAGDKALAGLSEFPRHDWRPNEGNVRYAWRGRQTANGYGVEISNGGHFPYFTGAMFYTLQDTTTNGGSGQFIFPACQEQYFWRLHRLPGYEVPHNEWTIMTADYINGTVHLYIDGQKIGWWPESDCSLNWYLKGQNATSPDILFFGNPATASSAAGGWSEVFVDWFATFPGLSRVPPL